MEQELNEIQSLVPETELKGDQKKPNKLFHQTNNYHIINQDQFKDGYDQIYTIGFFSSFYSSLSDQI